MNPGQDPGQRPPDPPPNQGGYGQSFYQGKLIFDVGE
jgi:hypothetical protein